MPEDIRLDALRYAILAPNPHNLQPWRFRLEGDDSVAILHDPERRLPERTRSTGSSPLGSAA
jgi:hypothetical protein